MTAADRRFIYQTDRLGVRGLDRGDLAGGYPLWFSDEAVCRHNSHGAFPKSAQELAAYIDGLASDRAKVVWAVIDRATGLHIGNMSLQSINWINRSAEFAVLMGEKEYWGRGYAREAGELLLRHGFLRLNLRRVYCGTAATNTGMQKLAESLGMAREGVRRQELYLNGEYTDLWEYGVLKDEFLAGR